MSDRPSEQAIQDEQFLADLWVGIALSFMVLSCITCLCSCFLYNAFKQWQRRVEERGAREDQMERGEHRESLPSYTVAAGLPSYEEAMERLSRSAPPTDPPTPVFARLSVGDLLDIYKADVKK